MLAEQIGNFHGRSTADRLLPSEGPYAKFETTLEAKGAILGISARILATYWSTVSADGHFYGKSAQQTALITEDGEIAVLSGSGAGRLSGTGVPVHVRGAMYSQGARGKLAALNGRALIYEWDEDHHGSLQIKIWEWK